MRVRSRKNKKAKGTTNQKVPKARTVTNIEDMTFCHEFSKTLEYIRFGDIYDENDDFETRNINFLVYDFSGQTTIPTECIVCRVFLITSLLYSEPNQAPKMKPFCQYS